MRRGFCPSALSFHPFCSFVYILLKLPSLLGVNKLLSPHSRCSCSRAFRFSIPCLRIGFPHPIPHSLAFPTLHFAVPNIPTLPYLWHSAINYIFFYRDVRDARGPVLLPSLLPQPLPTPSPFPNPALLVAEGCVFIATPQHVQLNIQP